MGDGELLIATREGQAVRFEEENARAMGRTARGVIAIRMEDEDEVVGVVSVDEERTLLTITEKGIGKRSPFDDFRTMKNRGGMGVTCHKLSEKTGKLSALAAVKEDDDIMIITDEGTIIRTHVCSIPVHARSTGGVIVMRLSDDAKIVTFARIEKEEDIVKEAEIVEEIARENEPAPSLPADIENDEDADSEDTEE
jgi:DNA gyrase subunit A